MSFIFDDFAGTNGTSLQSHTSDSGGTWSVHPGVWVSSQDIQIGNGSFPYNSPELSSKLYYSSDQPSSSEYDVSVVINRSALDLYETVYIAGRLSTSVDTYYAVEIIGNSSTLLALTLSKWVAGTQTILATGTVANTYGVDYTVKLEIRDAAKKVYVDGVEILSSADNTITATGRVGIRIQDLFPDLQIKSLTGNNAVPANDSVLDLSAPMPVMALVNTTDAGTPLLDLFTGTGPLQSHLADSGHTWTTMSGSAALNGAGFLTLNGLARSSASPIFTNEYSVTGQFVFPVASNGVGVAIAGRVDPTTGDRYQAMVTPTYVACGSAPVRVTYSLVQITADCFYIQASNAPGIYVGGASFCYYDPVTLNATVAGYQATADNNYNNALAAYNTCLDSNNLTFTLQQVTASGTVVLGTYALSRFTVGATYSVTLDLKDSAKRVLVNGTERISSNDNTITLAGNPGVYGTGTYLDSISTLQQGFATVDVTAPMPSIILADTMWFVPMATISFEEEGYHPAGIMPTIELGVDGVELTVPIATLAVGTNDLQLTVPLQDVSLYNENDFLAVMVPMAEVSIVAGAEGALLSMAAPRPTVAFTGLTGTVSALALDVPLAIFSANTEESLELIAPMPEMALVSETGEVCDLDLTVPLAFHDLISFTPEIVDLEIVAPASTVDFYSIVGAAASLDITIRMSILALENATGTVGTLDLTVPMLTASLGGYPQYVGTVVITVPMATLELTGHGPVPQTFKTYAINTRTLGLTEYQGLSINSFAKFNGVTLAATPTGIVALTGTTDGTAIIDASAKLARMNFGEQLTRVKDVFVSYRSDNAMVLTVDLEGDTQYQYTIEPRGTTGLCNSRAKLGRALKSKYWQFGLKNVDGADFDVDSIAFEPQVLKRKLG